MPPLCDSCEINKASIKAIVDGEYVHLCRDCRPRPVVNSGHARWERDIDFLDHEADLLQPYNADGSINTNFARLYPKQAAALFTPEQIRRANM